jgi:hypothetical protein
MKAILASETIPETLKTKLTYLLEVYESNKAYLVYSQPDY